MKRVRISKKALTSLMTAASLLIWTRSASGQSLGVFETVRISARSRGMGTVSGPVADDASALFLNPAGLVLSRGIILYGEYGDGGGTGSSFETRGAFVYPFERVVLGGGYYRRRRQPSVTGESIAFGAALRILEGAQGSFLSAGMNIRMDMISRALSSDCLQCGTGEDSDNAFSMDMGLMLRPLPMISMSYVVADLSDPAITTDYGTYRLQRTQRWGLAWIWDNRLIMGWEHTSGEGGGNDSFGFSLRTASPVELMAGYSSDKVSGGIRWVQHRFDCLVSFSPVDDGDVYTAVSAQIYFRRRPDEIVQ